MADFTKFMGQSQQEKAGLKGIQVNIHADADEETLNKWVEQIEARCPVNKLIQVSFCV